MGKEYFLKPATELAPDLLGKLLCRSVNGEVFRFRITETECYYGEEDSACHAHKGKTPRTEVMYAEGGRAYVYLCYGIHYLLNLTTGPEGHPEAVLIRGVEGAAGPGRVTKRLFVDKTLNGCLLEPENELWVEDDESKGEKNSEHDEAKGKRKPDYEALPRVGIDYAQPRDRDRLWRFAVRSEKK